MFMTGLWSRGSSATLTRRFPPAQNALRGFTFVGHADGDRLTMFAMCLLLIAGDSVAGVRTISISVTPDL